jgi:hypothetical protein
LSQNAPGSTAAALLQVVRIAKYNNLQCPELSKASRAWARFSKQLLPRMICCRGHRSLSGIVNNKRNTGASLNPKKKFEQFSIGSGRQQARIKEGNRKFSAEAPMPATHPYLLSNEKARRQGRA